MRNERAGGHRMTRVAATAWVLGAMVGFGATQAMAQATGGGSATVGASYSTVYGATADIGFEAEDLFGTGFDVNLSHRGGAEGRASKFAITRRWSLGDTGLGQDAELALTLTAAQSDWDNRPYSEQRAKVELRYSAAVTSNIRWSSTLFWQQERLDDLDAGLSPVLQQDAGTSRAAGLGFGVRYDSVKDRGLLDSGTSAHAGLRFAVDSDGYRGTTRLTAGAETTQRLLGTTVWRVGVDGGAIQGQGNNGYVHVLDRAFLGGDAPRGFAWGAAGPHDLTTGDALGGTKYATASVEILTPIQGDRFAAGLFADFGSAWDLPNVSGIDDSQNWRSSVGISAYWTSRFGTMEFGAAKAINTEPGDDTNRLYFALNTKF